MKLGVFGGTFDPVHVGHLSAAEALARRFRFDRLLFVPANVPPHKTKRRIAHPCHRVAMLALATADRDGWTVSTAELDCEPPHYTVDTVARLHAWYPAAAPLHFIMGADSFEELASWRDYLRLLESCHIIVTARPGHRLDADHLPEGVRRRIVDLRGAAPGEPEPADSSTRIYLTSDSIVDISSTAVREKARAGQPLHGLVPDAVAEYVRKQELYSDTHE